MASTSSSQETSRPQPNRQSTVPLERNVQESDAALRPPKKNIKITPWRFFNTVFLIALGTGKAVSAYQGQSIAPTTLDWIVGIVWALISYWCSIFEFESPNTVSWLFEFDLSAKNWFRLVIASPLGFCGVYGYVVCLVAFIQFVGKRVIATGSDNHPTVLDAYLLAVVLVVILLISAEVTSRGWDWVVKKSSRPAQLLPTLTFPRPPRSHVARFLIYPISLLTCLASTLLLVELLSPGTSGILGFSLFLTLLLFATFFCPYIVYVCIAWLWRG